MKGNHKPTGFSLTISETQKILTNFNIHQKLAVFSRKSLEQGQKGTARPSDPAPHPFLAPVSMSECEQDTASAAAPTSNHNEDGDNEEAGSEAAEFVSLPPPRTGTDQTAPPEEPANGRGATRTAAQRRRDAPAAPTNRKQSSGQQRTDNDARRNHRGLRTRPAGRVVEADQRAIDIFTSIKLSRSIWQHR